MSKVSFSNMKLKTKADKKIFKFNDEEIEIITYLPIERKYDFVNITLQKSFEEGIYNPLKLDMYFHLHLVYLYSNITFTEKQKENEGKLYDILKTNGFLEEFLSNIPEDEYTELRDFVNEQIQSEYEYKRSFSYTINKIISDLPTKAQAAASIVDNFDKEKFREVINFAQAANGGRPIIGTK